MPTKAITARSGASPNPAGESDQIVRMFMFMFMEKKSIKEARDQFSAVVDRAERDDEPTVITRDGVEVAAVVPIELFRQWQRWDEERILRLIDERRGQRTYSLAEVRAETEARTD